MTDWGIERLDDRIEPEGMGPILLFDRRGVGKLTLFGPELHCLIFSNEGDPTTSIPIGDTIEDVASMAAMLMAYGEEEIGVDAFRAVMDQAQAACRPTTGEST